MAGADRLKFEFQPWLGEVFMSGTTLIDQFEAAEASKTGAGRDRARLLAGEAAAVGPGEGVLRGDLSGVLLAGPKKCWSMRE